MRNLNMTLAELQKEIESGAPPYNFSEEQVDIMHAFEQELGDSGILDKVLRPGLRFPEFALPNHLGEAVELENLLLRGPVVINFFRGVWCPYCNLELQALQRSLNDIEAAGASLVAISPQSPRLNKRTALQNRLRFDLLSDEGNNLSSKIGVAYQLGDDLIEKVFKVLGADLSKFNGDSSWRLPLASRFVIDSNGVIVSSNSDVNFRKRPDPSETIAIVKAISRRTTTY